MSSPSKKITRICLIFFFSGILLLCCGLSVNSQVLQDGTDGPGNAVSEGEELFKDQNNQNNNEPGDSVNPKVVGDSKESNSNQNEKKVDVKTVSDGTEEEIENKWLESLRLRDFRLLPGYPDLKDKIKEYAEISAKHYEEKPDVFSAAVEYGLLLIDIGDIDKAEAVWERAVKDFVGNPTPKVYKAWVDAAKGNYLQAKNIWYEVAKEKLSSGISGYTAGMWLPYHIDSVLGLFLIKNYLPEKDKQEASEIVAEIAKHFALNPKFAAILITEDFQAGRIKSAADKLSMILERYPEDPIAITLLGIGQLLTGHYEDALKLFDNANEINPYSPTVHLMKARTLFAMDKKKESKTSYEKAIKIDPKLLVLSSKKIEELLTERSYLTRPEKTMKKLKKGKDKEIKESKTPNVPEIVN